VEELPQHGKESIASFTRKAREFVVPTKLVRMIKMCLNEKYACSKVCLDKHLSDNFPIQNGQK
jgi:hypothetical protein